MTDMPHGWQATTFGAVLTETHERRGGHSDLPVLSVTKTRGPMLASERFGKVLHSRDLAKYRVARRGTIVADPMLLWDGSIGRQDVVDAGLVSPDYRVYELADQVSSDFIRYVVRNPAMLRHYQGGARGTNVRRNRIARGDFLRIPLRLPPLLEQRKIAAILSAVDEVIAKTEAVIESLQALKRTMMQELLTRGLPGRHTRFKQTEIGGMPEEWKVAPLGELLDGIDAGWSPKCVSSPAKLNEWGVLKVSAVTWGIFDDSENKALPPDLEPRPSIEVATGDVIMSRANTPDLVGRAVVVHRTRPRLMLSDKLLRLRTSPRLLPAFLNLTLATQASRARIQDCATGSSRSMRNISQAKLCALQVPLPSTEEQRRITAAVAAIDSRLAGETNVAARSSSLKSALMSVLLTGELRVIPDMDAK